MFVVTVAFDIAPAQAGAFLDLVRENARLSVEREPGCQTFDVCWNEGAPADVFLFEVYDDQAAFQAHLATDHFRAFDAAVAGMVLDKQIKTYDGVAR